MTKKTHVAVGVAATLPDIDIRLGIEHRTITHSLIALLISTIVVMFCNFSVGLIFGLSFLIHLLLDSFTKMGVPLFCPVNKKYYGLKLIRTGGSEDFFICTEYLIK